MSRVCMGCRQAAPLTDTEYCRSCQLAGAALPSEDLATDAPPRVRERHIVVRLQRCCMMCGDFERDEHDTVVTHTLHGDVLRLPLAIERLRCRRCAGPLLVDEAERILELVESPWQPEADDLPRRGRPPKWLVEQRRRDREAAAAAVAELASA